MPGHDRKRASVPGGREQLLVGRAALEEYRDLGRSPLVLAVNAGSFAG
jgi:hypothetical protein